MMKGDTIVTLALVQTNQLLHSNRRISSTAPLFTFVCYEFSN